MWSLFRCAMPGEVGPIDDSQPIQEPARIEELRAFTRSLVDDRHIRLGIMTRSDFFVRALARLPSPLRLVGAIVAAETGRARRGRGARLRDHRQHCRPLSVPELRGEHETRR